MIGGTDIVIPAIGDSADLDSCVQIIRCRWRQARFENAITGEKYRNYPAIPFGQVTELLVYRDVQSEAAWDADSIHSPPNSMIYLIRNPQCITAVLDDPDATDVSSIIDSMRMRCKENRIPFAEAA